MQYNFFEITEENLFEIFKNTGKDSIVTSLAVDLGFGGIYSEEICLLSKINKNKAPQELSDKEIDAILKSIKIITNKKIEPVIYYNGNEAVDVIPFELKFHSGLEKKKFETFSESLNYYFSKEVKSEKKPTKHDSEIEKIKRVIEEQKATMENMKISENKNREKGELIYNNYKLIEEILTEINKAAEKYSWKEIKEKLQGHKIIKDLNIKDKEVVVEVD